MAQVSIYIANDLEIQIKVMVSSFNISTILEQKVQNEWSHGT